MKVPTPARRGRRDKLPTAIAVGSFAFKSGIAVRGFEDLLRHYLKELGLSRAGVSLLVCNDKESRHLNKGYRGKDAPTDILSFPVLRRPVPRGYIGHLGDLALDLPYAWRRRGRFSEDFSAELAFLLLHGLLHLKGVHHDSPSQERRMEAMMRRHFPPPAPFLKGLKSIKIKRSWHR